MDKKKAQALQKKLDVLTVIILFTKWMRCGFINTIHLIQSSLTKDLQINEECAKLLFEIWEENLKKYEQSALHHQLVVSQLLSEMINIYIYLIMYKLFETNFGY